MRIITDSAADFTPQELKQYNIRCVATQVVLGGQSYTARKDLSDEEFWRRLLAGEDAKTSQPSPGAYGVAFVEEE